MACFSANIASRRLPSGHIESTNDGCGAVGSSRRDRRRRTGSWCGDDSAGSCSIRRIRYRSSEPGR